MRTALVAVVLVSSLAISPTTLPATPSLSLAFLRTPSGNIHCGASSDRGAASLRCDIRSGLRPRPRRPRGCDFDWGETFVMSATGRAAIGCVSDAVVSPSARVLRYGTTWRRFGFTCVSRRAGLRCTNRSRHGFFLSRARSYRF